MLHTLVVRNLLHTLVVRIRLKIPLINTDRVLMNDTKHLHERPVHVSRLSDRSNDEIRIRVTIWDHHLNVKPYGGAGEIVMCLKYR